MAARDPDIDLGLDPERPDEEEEGLDFQTMKEMVGFTLRAPRRHRLLAWSIFAVVAALGLTVAETMPRTYNAEVKLLAQRDLVLPAVVNPSRMVPRDADNPTKNVAEMIMRRDNLVALAKEADLVDRFDSTRPAALRFKDRIIAFIAGPPTEQDKLRGIIGTLEKKLVVTADDATVTISVDWSDPETARDLVTLVQKNFLEAKYDTDAAILSDATAMLQDHAKGELEGIDLALAEYARGRKPAEEPEAAPTPGLGPSTPAPAPRRAVAPRPAPSTAAAPSQSASDDARALDDVRQRIKALEGERDRQIQTVQQQLSQAQLTLTPMHPTVLGLQQQLETLKAPSPELDRLKGQERALMAQIVTSAPAAAPVAGATAGGGGYALQPVGAPAAAAPGQAARAYAPGPQFEDPVLQVARSKLEAAIRRYQDLQNRIDSANIELDIARTAFKYRFSVVTPAEVPTKPKKPIAQVVGIGSVFFAGVFALLAAVLADMAHGRILETWQVRKRLKLEVLGEVESPR